MESKTISVILNIGSNLAGFNLTEKNVGLTLGILKEAIHTLGCNWFLAQCKSINKLPKKASISLGFIYRNVVSSSIKVTVALCIGQSVYPSW